jgi:hypothetical protein
MRDTFIHIRSAKFPVLPGEEEEIVNPGMFGKALGEYLQAELGKRGYDAPFVCAEDWGWWVELTSAPFTLGVCIYAGPREGEQAEFLCADGATAGTRAWNWKQFRFIDTAPWIDVLYEDLLAIFHSDPEVEVLGTPTEVPF